MVAAWSAVHDRAVPEPARSYESIVGQILISGDADWQYTIGCVPLPDWRQMTRYEDALFYELP